MSLLSVRKHFVEFTGRYDLVKDSVSYGDNGADFFIRAGQKWLDRFADIYQSDARRYVEIEIGGWYTIVPNIRSIKEVYISNNDGVKSRLKKVSFKELRDSFPSDPSLIDAGTTLIYSPTNLRVIPEVPNVITIDTFGPITYEIDDENHWNFTGLVFLPPTIEPIILEVHGSFYQHILSTDSSANFWSEEQEFILVLAASRALEISYRNMTGVRDWEAAIYSELQGLEFDLVQQQSSGYTQMEG